MLPDLPQYFIAVEGNIGAGKTTFVERLAADYKRRPILEQFADNPFLAAFYAEPERYALPVELFFMAERHKQLSGKLTQADLFRNGLVADYLFVKTLLFARNTLSGKEFRLFSRIFQTMDAGFPAPGLIVYLHRPIEVLRANIEERGREYERTITNDYLLSIQQAYLNYLRSQKDTAVLILLLGEEDFVSNTAVYERMLYAIARAPDAGLTEVNLRT